jgi:hypothetical protein
MRHLCAGHRGSLPGVQSYPAGNNRPTSYMSAPITHAANPQPINPNRMAVFKLANISTIASVFLLPALFCKQIDYMLSF